MCKWLLLTAAALRVAFSRERGPLFLMFGEVNDFFSVEI